jgi:Ca-activated chloride channel family protein
MRFASPALLWLLAALPALALGRLWSAGRRRRALRRYAGGAEFSARFERQVSPHRRATKALLLYIGLAALVVAAARPQWGTRLETVERRGSDVMIVLDTSLSMAAEDLAPRRLDLARHEIDQLLQRLEGNRIGLVTFAGQASAACPLTVDDAAVRLFLEAQDVRSSAVPGTALADALRVALRALGDPPPDSALRTRAIVLFSDGEDHEGGVDEVLAELQRAGVAVHAVGCGTTRGGPIPLADERGGEAGYKTDREGRVVTTRLDEAVLERLAQETGGRYHRATASGIEVDEIARALTALDEHEFGATLRSRYEERYQIPLALALVALVAESLVGDRRRRRRGVGVGAGEALP